MSQLFNQFFSKLNSTDIPYAITGRTENYPENIHSDIDIIIPNNYLKAFWNFLRNLEKEKINWVQLISHEATGHFCIVVSSNGIKHSKIFPDVCSDYLRNGKLFLKAEYLLANNILRPKDFYVLAPEKEFIYYLLKKIDKEDISKEQFKHLLDQWVTEPAECLTTTKQFFSKQNQLLIQQIFDTHDEKLMLKSISTFKKDLHGNLRFKVIDFLSRINNRVTRIIKPTGLIIAVLGPDGSGKTTIINGVKENLLGIFRQTTQYHLFPKEGKGVAPTIDPHNQKSRGYFGSVVKLFYFLGLYFLGYWVKIYPQKIRSTLVIFDRYYHDLLVDPKRYRHGAGNGWARLVGYFVPKPDLWILLDVPGNIIQQRKSEVAPEETDRQVIAYQKLFKRLNNAFVINANQTPEKVIYDTEQVILDHLKRRTSERYKQY